MEKAYRATNNLDEVNLMDLFNVKGLSSILEAFDLYTGDNFMSPFILDTVIMGEGWAEDFGDTAKERILMALEKIDEFLNHEQVA